MPRCLTSIMLGVTSADRSVAFYRDIIGLQLQHHQGGFAFLAAGGVTIALSEQLGRFVTPVAGAVEVVFPVESVRTEQSALQEKGCDFLNDAREVSPGSWAVTLKDPDGHMLTLFGPK